MLFNNFDICFSQNQETRKYLKHLGARKIKLIGNLKFSESKSQKNNYIDDKLKKIFKSKKIWCAASTHHSEEQLLSIHSKHAQNTTLKITQKYINLVLKWSQVATRIGSKIDSIFKGPVF